MRHERRDWTPPVALAAVGLLAALCVTGLGWLLRCLALTADLGDFLFFCLGFACGWALLGIQRWRT